MHTKHQVLQDNLLRYLTASKPVKTTLLDEWTVLLSMHRKSIIRYLRRQQMKIRGTRPNTRGPKERYGPAVTAALHEVWELSSELCAERLHPIIPEYVRILQRDHQWHHANDVTQLLGTMSVATLKRRLRTLRSSQRIQRHTTTYPSVIRSIPIRHGPWINPPPGYGEVDTVVHCGDMLVGNMAYSVNYTDIATTWWEGDIQMNKGQYRTQESIHGIQQRLPFPLCGIDPDSGSEFINLVLYQWCQAEQIELTRSRPYHKNDNAHIEQKNGSITRKFLGYTRIDTEEQIALAHQLVTGPLRLYVNFFQPSMQLQRKDRVGARYRRIYDQPKTPYQRVLEHPDVTDDVKSKLTELYETLNPLLLKQQIDRLTRKIFTRPLR